MADIDYGTIKIYTGNYDFWYESSQLAAKLQEDKNKRLNEKAEELKAFIARFSANASKSKQATSRSKQLAKITLEDIQPSTRRYPFVGFKPEREAGDQMLRVEGLTKSIDGVKVLNNVSFQLDKADKVVFTGSELSTTTLFKILMGELSPDSGKFTWGVTTSRSYFPKDNSHYFIDQGLSLIDWLRQYSGKEQSENFIRGFLGRMLFSGDEALKQTHVLSGGEKVRCMLAKMMLSSANVLILDGPTNHLDLESITAVNNGLTRFPGTILFTSHDRQFIETIATRVIEITPTGVKDDGLKYPEYLASLLWK
jgi:ATPase subunit of ABC transporter with duplicated ATPase domains